jgi:hypothetical protein
MGKWIVPVCRIGYAVREIEVEADSATQAIEIAQDAAGGLEFSEHSSEYKAEFAQPKDKWGADETTPN